MLQGWPALRQKLARLILEMDGVAEAVVTDSVGDVVKAVRADIGDTSMSGWPRANPIQVRGMVERNPADGLAAIVPFGRTGGQLRVLNEGRNAGGGAGGFQGPGINRRTGRTSAKTRATGRGGSRGGRRYNGQTRGKGSWDDAEQLMGRSLLVRSANQFAQGLARIFNKG